MKKSNLWFVAALIVSLALVFAGCASTGGSGPALSAADLRSGDQSVVDGMKVSVLQMADLNQHTEVWLDLLPRAAAGSGVYFFFIKEADNIDGMGGCGVIGPDWSEAPNPGNVEIIVPAGTGDATIFSMGPYEPSDVISWEAGWAPGRVVLGSWANGVIGLDRAEFWVPVE